MDHESRRAEWQAIADEATTLRHRLIVDIPPGQPMPARERHRYDRTIAQVRQAERDYDVAMAEIARLDEQAARESARQIPAYAGPINVGDHLTLRGGLDGIVQRTNRQTITVLACGNVCRVRREQIIACHRGEE